MAEQSVFEAAIQNFLGPVIAYLKDETVSEILINGPKEIFVERAGKLSRVNVAFQDEDSLQAAVRNIAQSVGRRIDDEQPSLDARLPDGSRIHAVFPPCARNGTTVSIRKFLKTKMNFTDYVKKGSLTVEAAQFLDICMFLGKNIVVSGGTGSGKTTLLGLLASRIPPGQRVILIEDASELTFNYEHVVRFETRLADEQGRGEVSMRELLRSSLRLRPDRIIVGECRGAEAIDLINAMNTGHKGCLGTIHANSPTDCLTRIETLALSGEGHVSETALRAQIASGIQLVVQISRMPDGSRKVTHISEVCGLTADKSYQTIDLFCLGPTKREADGRISSQIQTTGELPSFIDEIEGNRIPFGRDKFRGPQAA